MAVVAALIARGNATEETEAFVQTQTEGKSASFEFPEGPVIAIATAEAAAAETAAKAVPDVAEAIRGNPRQSEEAEAPAAAEAAVASGGLENWSAAEVTGWLRSIGLAEYAPEFGRLDCL